jgi:hypothetical protein
VEEELKPFLIFIGKFIGLLLGLLILFALISFITYILSGTSIHNTAIEQVLIAVFVIVVLAILNPWRN